MQYAKRALTLGLVAVAGAACSHSHSTGDNGGHHLALPLTPTVFPTPTPSPSPTPTPVASPTASPTGINVVVELFPRNKECPPGVTMAPVNDVRVGCSVEVRVSFHYLDGKEVPEKVTGQDIAWKVEEGADNLTLPWDENPGRRWLSAKAPGPYRIGVTLTLKKSGEKVSGILAGDLVP